MPRAGALYDVFYFESLARAGVKRADALLDIAAQAMELLDIGPQLLADSLLRRLGQPCRLGDRVVEYLAHVNSL